MPMETVFMEMPVMQLEKTTRPIMHQTSKLKQRLTLPSHALMETVMSELHLINVILSLWIGVSTNGLNKLLLNALTQSIYNHIRDMKTVP